MARTKARDRVPAEDKQYLEQLRYILHALLMRHDSFGLFSESYHKQAKNLERVLKHLGINLSDTNITDEIEGDHIGNFRRLLGVFCNKKAYGLWGAMYSSQRLIAWSMDADPKFVRGV